MDDNRKRPGPGKGRGPGKPASGGYTRGGDRPPAGRQDGAKRAFAGRDGAPGKPRPGKREREEAARGGEAVDGERIARRLARAGVASRRDAEAMIAAGRITLNGKVVDSPALNVTSRDSIALDGQPIPAIERTRLFLFHKPAGLVTTNRDPQGRRTVFDVLPKELPRLMTVGRLDINTEGLLLLTNDGGLARMLELPETGWLRRYRARVHGKVDLAALEGLKEGIAVDGVFYGAVEAVLDREQGSNAWLTLGLREGKNREVRNILGALGLDVTRLIRVSYGPFQLGELAEGEVRELRGRVLRDQLGEKLIAEAGANFDAPILNEFSSKPVAAKPRRQAETEAAGPPNRKREREAKREEALGRLDTRKPAFGGSKKPDFDRPKKPAFGGPKKSDFGGPKKPGGRPARPAEDGRPRAKAEEARPRGKNVWMAPGAKPMGEKKKAELAERSEGRRYAGKPRPSGGGGGAQGPRKPRPSGGAGAARGAKGPRKPRGQG